VSTSEEYVRYCGTAALVAVGRSAAGSSRKAIGLARADMVGVERYYSGGGVSLVMRSLELEMRQLHR
jgi:hypothetical protein